MVFSAEWDEATKLPFQIWQMESAIKNLKWWQFLKRWKLQDELTQMKILAAQVGFHLALKDLEKIGLIKIN